ncbi:hypothetical protein PAHAL_5G517800 [Panicum hallii]|uniref:Uncharacterized protein n=1 Tax=Panicum hallii TaxID=206008 RepID=A0A2S3HZJ4_9POAL|nr:uncharacterized protein LOC112894831 [Panicum hallii]XP_025818438.1 uncharacterized protein LOC112894831 [Panicum hallii]PAN32869.1 hypothetical protein PAHAL_5G517800 [Panicum hallii]
MEASPSTLHAAAATGASAAPLALHRCCRGGSGAPRTRAPAVRAQGAAREPDPRAVPVEGGGPPALPKAALRVGAGVALALALGGASWTARGGSAAGPDLQPAMVCALNAVTDGASRASAERTGAANMKTSVEALSDSLFRREDSPRDRATLMDLVFEQVTKEHITDRGKLTSLLQKEFSASRDSERKLDLGLLLTDVLINQRDWQRAKEVCQQLTGRYQRDSRPYLHLAVINMMMAVEGMLSPDTATTDDIEKTTKNAMDAWKEFKNKSELSKGSADSTA